MSGDLDTSVLFLTQQDERKSPDGTRSFTTEDRNLPELWNRTIRDALFSDEESWEKM